MAHRGASDARPENTLAAFELPLRQGADVLETDLRFTRDDVIVLMHDPTLDRTTDGSGAVSEMTLQEIKQARAKFPSPVQRGRGAGGGWGVPTLEELLQFTRGATPLALELKDPRFEQRRDAERLVELLARYDMLQKCVLVSFHLARLLSFKPIAPTLPIGMITLSNALPRFPTEFLGPFWLLLYANPLYVAWARRLGKIVCPLDPAPEPRLRYYRRLGVSVVLTNHPAVTVQALNAVKA
jgi:glycerophosphoryl diester phosphodiesterase